MPLSFDFERSFHGLFEGSSPNSLEARMRNQVRLPEAQVLYYNVFMS
jgi:hypothetical protein